MTPPTSHNAILYLSTKPDVRAAQIAKIPGNYVLHPVPRCALSSDPGVRGYQVDELVARGLISPTDGRAMMRAREVPDGTEAFVVLRPRGDEPHGSDTAHNPDTCPRCRKEGV